jgi:hypothetical protein
MPPRARTTSPGLTVLIAVAALGVLFGALLRNAWLEDMEWKSDERRMFDDALRVARGEPLPWVGMRSGVGTANPGMSLWIFAALVRLGDVETPIGLARAVVVMNTLALALLALFAATRRDEDEREAWLWATTLACVSPSGVQLQRKIWAQSVLPLLSLATLTAWWYRRRRAGAFGWGLIGACLGQIHMSGFFWAAALAGYTALAERGAPREDGSRTRWGSWLAGSVAGAGPLLPWARLALLQPGGSPTTYLFEPLHLGFWRHAVIDAAGAGTYFSLGRGNFGALLREPIIAGVPSCAVAAVQLTAVALTALAVAGGLRALARAPGWRARLFGGGPTRLLQNTALLAYGGLITASAIRFRPHYLLVLFPLVQLALARAALAHPKGRRILAGLVAAQALLAAAFILQVHVRGGAPGGDYGVSYRSQGR